MAACDLLLSLFHLTSHSMPRYFTAWLISQMVNDVSAHLSSTFAALADPTRRAILARLARGELSVKELAEPFPITAPSMTKHLKVLERAGLISRSRDAQRRPCRLQSAPLREVAEWVEQYRRSRGHNMNRAARSLGRCKNAKGGKHARREKH